MKKVILKIVVLLCILVLAYAFSSSEIANATSSISDAINTIGTGGDGNDGGASEAATKILGAILNIVRIVGAAIAIAMLLIVATKYIIASAGDRADIKKYAINYVIGALIFLGASGILTIIRSYVISTTAST